jgi:hypothetical protein
VPLHSHAVGVSCGVYGTPLLENSMNYQELLAHIDEQVRTFQGDLTQLERAIGALIAGRQFGWKVLLLVHDRKTIAKYGAILKIDFKEVLPAEGKFAHKSFAWVATQKVASFWKAVKGEYPDIKSVQVK